VRLFLIFYVIGIAAAWGVSALLPACGDDAPSFEDRCAAKGGVYISVYKSRDICLKREAVIEYEP
jgi:hypothetical protein